MQPHCTDVERAAGHCTEVERAAEGSDVEHAAEGSDVERAKKSAAVCFFPLLSFFILFACVVKCDPNPLGSDRAMVKVVFKVKIII